MTVPDRPTIEPLDRRHDRSAFSCGITELDRHLMHQAGQDVRRRFVRVFVYTSGRGNAVPGFYILGALSIGLDSLPAEPVRKLPRHPVPCVLLGRLAVDAAAQGRGIGSMLIADAIKRSNAVGTAVGVYAMIVDATNEIAKPCYMAFGFLPFQIGTMCLFLPLGPADFQGDDLEKQSESMVHANPGLSDACCGGDSSGHRGNSAQPQSSMCMTTGTETVCRLLSSLLKSEGHLAAK